MLDQIKFELDKNDWNYTKILELLLSLNVNAKIINYEDIADFESESNTVIICDRSPEIENVLNANSYKYTYC